MTIDNPAGLGTIILTLVAVAWGGSFLLGIVNGRQAVNELQRTYFRAGHAHAGVLVTLGLLLRLILAAEGVPAWGGMGATGVLTAAILMPAGFFLSVIGKDPERPNALRHLIALGGVILVAGLVTAGVALLLTH